MNLADELEHSIGDGPPLPSPDQRLAAGRAALRRRRMVVGAAAACALAVVLPVSLALGGLTDRAAEPPPVAPTVTDSVSPEADPFVPRQGAPVDIDRTTRELVFEPGVVVERRTDGVARGIDGQSAALVLVFEGRTYWVLTAWDGRQGDTFYDTPEDSPDATFDEFVARHLPKLEAAYAVEGGAR